LLAQDFGDAGMFVTAVHADVDPATGGVELADAGHGLAFILRATGEREPLRSAGLPIGMGVAFAGDRDVTVARLDPGDCLICCSDGLLDVLDSDDPFGHAARAIHELGPQGAVDEAMRLSRSERATDDVTAVVIRRDV